MGVTFQKLAMKPMNATFHGQTDTGRVRDNNEDAFVLQRIWDNDHLLCVVIDGLGGYEGGEVAAEIAATTIINYLEANNGAKTLELLKQAVVEANNAIVAGKADRPELAKMGCVLTASIIDLQARQLNVAHVGDTRLYRIVGGNIAKLTHDHSIVGYLEETGRLGEEEAMNHPNRNVIERCLGDEMHQTDDKDFIDSAIFPIADGEKLLFCSDGLCDMLTSAEIMDTMSDDCEASVQDLIDKANDKGGRDNVTVIIVAFPKEENDKIEANPYVGSEPVIIPASEEGMEQSSSTVLHLGSEPDTETVAGRNDSMETDMASDPRDPGELSTERQETTGFHQLLAGAWIPCILIGMVVGYAAGNHNMASSNKVYADSVTTLKGKVDSLQLTISSLSKNDSTQQQPSTTTEQNEKAE